MRSLTKSNRHFERAVGKLPLGVSSNFRYWGDTDTIYVDHGKGGRIWDIDGNEYIDYRLAYGPIILGYADERVDEAARILGSGFAGRNSDNQPYPLPVCAASADALSSC